MVYEQKVIERIRIRCSEDLATALTKWTNSVIVIEDWKAKERVVQILRVRLSHLAHPLGLEESALPAGLEQSRLSETERLDYVFATIRSLIDRSEFTFFLLPDITTDLTSELAIAARLDSLNSASFIQAQSIDDAVRQLLRMGFTTDDVTQFNFINYTRSASPDSVLVFPPARIRPARPKVVRLPPPIKCGLSEYVERLRLSLVARWRSSTRNHVYTGITSLANLKPRLRHRHADYKMIPGFSREQGFGLVNTDRVVEVWVNSTLGFRTYIPLFDKAMATFHGFRYIWQNNRRFQLDHAFNREASKNLPGSSFVLLTPIPGAVNGSWNQIERDIALDPLGNKIVQFGTWFILPKLIGIHAPTEKHDRTIQRGLDRIKDELLEAGAITRDELEVAERELKEFYTGVLRGREIRKKKDGRSR